MRKNFLKTMKRSKYVLGISAVALMGAVMMSTSGNCMAMISCDGSKAEEGSSASVVEEHRDTPVSECNGTPAKEKDHSDASEAKKSDDVPKSEEQDDASKANKNESTKMKFSKAEAIKGIRKTLQIIKDEQIFADEENFAEISKQAEIEISNLSDAEITRDDLIMIFWRIEAKCRINKAKALEDIESVFNLIKDHHVSAVERIPSEVRDQFELEIENLGDKVTCIDEWRIISRILSKLHDAHSIVWQPGFLNKKLPIETEYRDGRFVCTVGDNAGYEIEAINGILVTDLYKIFQEHFSYEIEEWTEYNFFEDPADFIPEWKLALCGIDTTKPIELKLKRGEDRKVLKVDLIEMLEPEKEPLISYKFDTENSIGCYRFDECAVSDELKNFWTCLEQGKCNLDMSSIKDEYAKSLHEFFSGVKEKGIKNVVVDLRKNYGGSSLVANLFILYLAKFKDYKTDCSVERKGDKIETHDRDIITLDMLTMKLREKLPLFDGKVYVLTSHGTFSAAMDFAVLLSDNGLATIVGEVPGNAVTCFGDTTDDERECTPNFRLEFRTTFKRFERPDPTKDKYRLIPDVQVPAKDALAKVYELVEAEKRADE